MKNSGNFVWISTIFDHSLVWSFKRVQGQAKTHSSLPSLVSLSYEPFCYSFIKPDSTDTLLSIQFVRNFMHVPFSPRTGPKFVSLALRWQPMRFPLFLFRFFLFVCYLNCLFCGRLSEACLEWKGNRFPCRWNGRLVWKWHVFKPGISETHSSRHPSRGSPRFSNVSQVTNCIY